MSDLFTMSCSINIVKKRIGDNILGSGNIIEKKKQGIKQSSCQKYEIWQYFERGVLYKKNFCYKNKYKMILNFSYNVMHWNLNFIKK